MVSLWGCAGGPGPRHVASPFISKQAVYADLLMRREAIRSLRAEATLHYRSRMGRGSEAIVVLVQSPLNIRLESLPELGTLSYQLISHAGTLIVAWPSQHQYYRGVGTREEMERYVSFSLTPEEAVAYLLSAIPLEPEEDYQMTTKKGRIWLRGLRGDIEVEEIEGRYRPIEVIERSLDGSVVHRIRYGKFNDSSGFSFPFRIEGSFSGGRASLSFDRVELNPSLEVSLFEVEIPEDAERVY